MPQPLSKSTRRAILQRLLETLSYDKVAAQLGVSKGAVAGVWREFAEGKTPGLEHLREHAETLQAVGEELRRTGISPGDAALGLHAWQALAKLGLEPGRLLEYVRLAERFSQDGEEAPEVIQAALEMQRLEESTGLRYETLVERVRELAERRQMLKVEVADLAARQKEVQGLLHQREDLQGQVGSLLERRDSLQKDVAQRERREAELSKRVQQKEEQDQVVGERLAVARKATAELATMGLSLEDLPGLAQRLGAIAQRREISPGDLRQRLLEELEKLEEGLALEALVAAQNKAQETVARLQAEKQRLEITLVVLREKALEQVEKAGDETAKSVRQGAQRFQGTLDGLLQQTLELAGKAAELDANMRSHEWLTNLVSLREGKGDLKPGDVRKLALILLPSLHAGLKRHEKVAPQRACYELESLVRIFQEWRA